VKSVARPSSHARELAEPRRKVEELSVKIAERFGDERVITRATLLGGG